MLLIGYYDVDGVLSLTQAYRFRSGDDWVACPGAPGVEYILTPQRFEMRHRGGSAESGSVQFAAFRTGTRPESIPFVDDERTVIRPEPGTCVEVRNEGTLLATLCLFVGKYDPVLFAGTVSEWLSNVVAVQADKAER